MTEGVGAMLGTYSRKHCVGARVFQIAYDRTLMSVRELLLAKSGYAVR